MEGQGSSFIPKNSAHVSKTRVRGTQRIYILSYISYIVFFGTLFTVAGVYLYAASVDRSIEALKGQLSEAQDRFSESDIQSIKTLDARLNKAGELLNKSAAPSAIFDDLEKIVSARVLFSAIKYEYLTNGQFKLALTGQAANFDDVLWQQELLKGGKVLGDAVVSKYDYSVEGEESEGAASGQAVLSFILTETKPTSLIPYVAPATTDIEEGSTEEGEEGDDSEEVEATVETGSASSTVEVET